MYNILTGFANHNFFYYLWMQDSGIFGIILFEEVYSGK